MGRLVYTDQSGRELSVPFGPDCPLVTIGRATDCTIRSNRKSVSRHHAEFHYTDGMYEIVDLNSSNGTYLIINEERKPVLSREMLAHNDEVWCGDFILHFFDDAAVALEVEDDYDSTINRKASDFQDVFEPVATDMGVKSLPYGSQNDPPTEHEPLDYLGAEPSAPFTSRQPFDEEQFEDFQSVGGSGGGGGQDIERLKAEKKSIEDFAARQAMENDDLRGRLSQAEAALKSLQQQNTIANSAVDVAALEQVQASLDAAMSDLDAALQDADATRRDLESARRERQELQDKLKEAARTAEQLEEERARAVEAEGKLGDALARLDEQRIELDDAGALAAELSELRDQLKASEQDLDLLERELEEAKKAAGKSPDADALKKEVDRHSRLLKEFERRNRELQVDLDAEVEKNHELIERCDTQAARLEELEAEQEAASETLAAVKKEKTKAKRALTTANDAKTKAEASIDKLKASNQDLKSEIEGLKRRLKMEKKRAQENEDAAQLEEENAKLKASLEALNAQLEAIESSEQASDHNGELLQSAAMVALLGDLRKRIETLDRIVDAIERTDLQPLSTVDRIRLQSAIRDTTPKQTLQELRNLTVAQPALAQEGASD